jgi:phage-related protein
MLGIPHARSMNSVARGVFELRVTGQDGAYRVFYCVTSPQGILVFPAFAKKTQRTAPADIELGKRRLKEMLDAQT